jgi:hypothetical protein
MNESAFFNAMAAGNAGSRRNRQIPVSGISGQSLPVLPVIPLGEPENRQARMLTKHGATRNFLQGGQAMDNETESAKVCKLLPHEVRERLVKAARTPTPPGDPLARARAIEEAALYARLRQPALFQR